MREMNLNAFILNTRAQEVLRKICGFTGTYGLLIVTQSKKCPFFTDGRYITQAYKQLDHNSFTIYNTQEKNPYKWIKEHLTPRDVIGYYAECFTLQDIKAYEDVCQLIPCCNEKVDNASEQRIVIHSIEYSGENSQKKCTRIASTIHKTDALLLTDLDSISWLLNVRNEDSQHTPHVLCYAILHKNSNVDLFIHGDKIEVALDNHVSIFHINELEHALGKLDSITIDPNTIPMSIFNLVKDKHLVEDGDPCLLDKAVKNSVEIAGALNAHIKDAVAVTNFLCWLEKNIDNGLSELDAEEKILDYRREQSLFKQLSFSTISAFNENAAIVHYRANSYTNKVIQKNGLYLIDSGGQYLDGTTDVTRTLAIGVPTREQITHYTLVLKAHIAIASAIFPFGTTGGELDILARVHLWKFGIDYMHGTGHGVGSYLSVHEGPQAISKGNMIKLVPGMILSNEPGYYIPNRYGIRIENLMCVCKQENGFLGFTQLTSIPYDHKLIDVQMLTYEEITWVNHYHQSVFKKLEDHLEDREWLQNYINFC